MTERCLLRAQIILLTALVTLSSCTNSSTESDWAILRLSICDWPLPDGLELQISDLHGHRFHALSGQLYYRAVVFIPLEAQEEAKIEQEVGDHVLEFLEDVGDATIYEFRMTHPDFSVLRDRGVERTLVAYLADMRINFIGFSVSDARDMLRHCQQTQR